MVVGTAGAIETDRPESSATWSAAQSSPRSAGAGSSTSTSRSRRTSSTLQGELAGPRRRPRT